MFVDSMILDHIRVLLTL